jgi:ribose 1,5-bisphosphate isomerase
MDARLEKRVEQVANDDSHGASWLAVEAVEAVREAVELGEDPISLGRELVASRPALGAIAGALGRVLAAGRSDEQVLEEARAMVESRVRAARAIAVLLGSHIEGVVLTHSNSDTVREALIHTPPERVVCTTSEPGGEGRDLAERLREEGFAVDIVDDSDAEHAVQTVRVLLIGADTVFHDGSLVNKVGTAGLAKTAKEAGVPVLVACEVIKLTRGRALRPHPPGAHRPLLHGGGRLRARRDRRADRSHSFLAERLRAPARKLVELASYASR